MSGRYSISNNTESTLTREQLLELSLDLAARNDLDLVEGGGEIPTTEIVFDPMKTLGIPLDIAVECGFRSYGMEATCVFHRTTPAHEQTSFASCWSSDANSHAQP